MRVIEPNNTPRRSDKSKVKRIMPIAIILIVLSGAAIYFINKPDEEIKIVKIEQVQGETKSSEVHLTNKEPIRLDAMRTFNDNEFKVFYDNLLLPNLKRVENPPFITGNDEADARIRRLGENRGYRLRSSPEGSLIAFKGLYLQQPVISSWVELQKKALDNGLNMSVVSAYRSVDEQRKLFVSRLNNAGANVSNIILGNADEIINKILETTAIPGYSKHHTGYTVDLFCAGYEFENFKNSNCFEWLSANNYEEAKAKGFIPSYPPEADAQGPNPEAWEYVWVGVDYMYY